MNFNVLITFIFCLLQASSCKEKHAQSDLQPAQVATNHAKDAAPAPAQHAVYDTVVHKDSTTLHGERIIAYCTDDWFLFVLDARGDTIFTAHEISPDFKFEDFDHDGYDDIRISYPGNTPGVEGLILYNPSTNHFEPVADFDSYPSPELVRGTKYYYSYSGAGCADLNWVSDLFYIVNFRAVRIGNIIGEGCTNAGDRNSISIYTVKHERPRLIQRFPIGVIEKYKENKWGFLRHYWTRNYRTFTD